MNPMTAEEAQRKKTFFAKAYFLSSLATFSFVIYQIKKGRMNWLENEGLISENNANLSPAFQYAQMLGTENATIIRIKGTQILNTKEYNKESFNVDEHVLEENNSDIDNEKKFLRL